LLAADWRGGAALAENHRGHTLPHHALGVSVGQNGFVRVVVDVDEPGGYGKASGVDRPRGGAALDPPYRDDSAAFDGDVAEVPGISGAIDDLPAPDEHVEILAGKQRGETKQKDLFHGDALRDAPYLR
jgi:hypothetical protein